MSETWGHAREYIARRVRRDDWTRRTLEQNRSRLGSFATAMPTVALITAARVEKWVHDDELAPRTRAGRLSAARGFCRWLTSEGHLKRDPSLQVSRPKIVEGLPRALNHDEVAAVLAECDQRTTLIVLLMTQEALRRAEVAAIQHEDLDWRNHTLAVRGKNGRGQITDVLPVSDETWNALLEYVDGTRTAHGALIRSPKTKAGIGPGRIGDLVKEAMCAAGVKRFPYDGRSAHALRHTAAHDIIDRTENLYAVKQALRHQTITSTEIYLRGSVRDLRDTMGGRYYGGESA